MGFRARYFPAIMQIRNNDKESPHKRSIIVMHDNDYESFDLFSYCGFIEWNIVRLIWIAFLKNDDNDKCMIRLLPKDIVNHVIKFLGLGVVESYDIENSGLNSAKTITL